MLSDEVQHMTVNLTDSFFGSQYSCNTTTLSLFSFVLDQTKIHCICCPRRVLSQRPKPEEALLAVPGCIKGERSVNCFSGQKKSLFDWWAMHLDEEILNPCWENLVTHPKQITESTQSALYTKRAFGNDMFEKKGIYAVEHWLLVLEVLNLFSYLSIRNYRESYLEVFKVIFCCFLASK